MLTGDLVLRLHRLLTLKHLCEYGGLTRAEAYFEELAQAAADELHTEERAAKERAINDGFMEE